MGFGRIALTGFEPRSPMAQELRRQLGATARVVDSPGQAEVVLHALDDARERGATVLLTSHYMGDVTALASRVLVIDHGTLLFDGDLAALVERQASNRADRWPDDPFFDNLGRGRSARRGVA